MWYLYILLRDLVDFIFADSCTIADSVYLKHKIEDHHSLFRRVFFPERKLLPKHHMFTHYLSIMRKVGPHSRCSSMRFEAKHYESKCLCNVVCCFKDICKTVVQKHQMNQCVRLAQGNSAKHQVIVQRVEVSILNELPERDLILSSLEGIQRHDDVAHAVSVEVGGTTYRKHMVVVLHVDDEPLFGLIVRCLIVPDDLVYFVCQELKVEFYNSHFHAYAVQQGNSMRVISHSSLQHYKPLSVHSVFDTDKEFVVFP